MSSILGAKAITLAQTGQVTERPHARVYTVKTYTVVLNATGHRADVCTCTAGQRGLRCSHVAAARLVLANELEREQ